MRHGGVRQLDARSVVACARRRLQRQREGGPSAFRAPNTEIAAHAAVARDPWGTTLRVRVRGGSP
ncbi:MAG TPA: hypothetical protein VLD17_03780 [Gemmatimonadaceae bacterium]|nr:hypothetical protein [Gemmatimonadaceae bacterium]